MRRVVMNEKSLCLDLYVPSTAQGQLGPNQAVTVTPYKTAATVVTHGKPPQTNLTQLKVAAIVKRLELI